MIFSASSWPLACDGTTSSTTQWLTAVAWMLACDAEPPHSSLILFSSRSISAAGIVCGLGAGVAAAVCGLDGVATGRLAELVADAWIMAPYGLFAAGVAGADGVGGFGEVTVVGFGAATTAGFG